MNLTRLDAKSIQAMREELDRLERESASNIV